MINWENELKQMVDEMRERAKDLDQAEQFIDSQKVKSQCRSYSRGYAEAVCYAADEIQKMFAKAEEDRR